MLVKRRRQRSFSSEETLDAGRKLLLDLPQTAVLAISGDLGAGKTTLVKGIVEAATEENPRTISSPTFTYLNIYHGTRTVYHFDLYRLKEEKEFLNLGLSDYLEAEGICCIEWPERIPNLLPKTTLFIQLLYRNESEREILFL